MGACSLGSGKGGAKDGEKEGWGGRWKGGRRKEVKVGSDRERGREGRMGEEGDGEREGRERKRKIKRVRNGARESVEE